MEKGNIVCSLAGHDKGIYSVIVGSYEKGYLVSDGKHRGLSNPKPKNPKHLKLTGHSVATEKLVSDKAVRRGIFAEMSAYKEEKLCQKKI